jgi:hypothetical protein
MSVTPGGEEISLSLNIEYGVFTKIVRALSRTMWKTQDVASDVLTVAMTRGLRALRG